MNLYRDEDGIWYGTQAEAKAGAQGKSWQLVEVPTDKPSLLAWLNAENSRSGRSEAPAPRQMPKLPVQELQAHNIRIEEDIAKADLPNAIRLASHALCRVQEHLNASL